MSLAISVVIPSYRRPESLGRGLAALARQQRRPERVLVVVRPDDGETRRVVAAAGDGVEEVLVHEPGLVAALNAGVGAARTELVAVTDDDTEPDPRWLERVHRHFAEDPSVGAVGGRDLVFYGERLVDEVATRVGRVAWHGKVCGFHHAAVGAPRDVEILKGCNMTYRRAALPATPFDPRLRGAGTEHHSEPSTCLRLRREGWRVVLDPAAAVVHRPAGRAGGATRALHEPALLRPAVHNETLALLEYLPPGRRTVYLAWAMAVGYTHAPGLAHALRLSLTAPRSRPWRALRATIGGHLDALETRRDAPAWR